jgi:effector-binding domain-containing protein
MLIIIISIFALIIFADIEFSKDVQIKKNDPFTYAYLDCSGPSSQTVMQINEFIGTFYKQRLMPTGKLFFLFYDFPGEVNEAENVRWAIGLPVSENSEIKEPLKKGEFKFPEIAYSLYKGPYEKSSDTYFKVLEYIKEKGYIPAGPAIQRHLDDPNKIEPENLRTEIIIPVVEKQ